MSTTAIQIGVKKLYYAILSVDTTSTLTYGTPVQIQGVSHIYVTTNPDVNGQMFGKGQMNKAGTLGLIDIEIRAGNLTTEVLATLLGHNVTDGVVRCNKEDQAPYVAIGFESEKLNGSKVFTWIFKGFFREPNSEYETKNSGGSLQIPTIAGTFFARVNDGEWKAHTDEDLSTYTESIGNTWFDSVQ